MHPTRQAADTYFFRAYGGGKIIRLGSKDEATAWAIKNALTWKSGTIMLEMSGDTELDWIDVDRDIQDEIDFASTAMEIAS